MHDSIEDALPHYATHRVHFGFIRKSLFYAKFTRAIAKTRSHKLLNVKQQLAHVGTPLGISWIVDETFGRGHSSIQVQTVTRLLWVRFRKIPAVAAAGP